MATKQLSGTASVAGCLRWEVVSRPLIDSWGFTLTLGEFNSLQQVSLTWRFYYSQSLWNPQEKLGDIYVYIFSPFFSSYKSIGNPICMFAKIPNSSCFSTVLCHCRLPSVFNGKSMCVVALKHRCLIVTHCCVPGILKNNGLLVVRDRFLTEELQQ